MNPMTPGSAGTTGAIRTPDQRLRVFVSSTLRELEGERRAVRGAVEAIRLAPVMFELGARPHPPRDLYRSYLAQSDVFVGVYADSYGWVAPGEEISGLEDEYRLAPPEMPKLIYLREPAERDARLEALVQRIREDDTASYKSFSTSDELAELVEADLAVLLAERFDASRAAADARAERAHETPMPAPYSRIIGREREIADVMALLTSGAHRVVTLLGPGGIGKSRLSLEVVEAARPHYPGGACFVGLENVFEPRLLLPTIAYALGIRDGGDLPVEERLRLALASRRMLIVLDNFEQLVAAAPELVSLYALAPETSFLVTSRAVLRVRGERVYEVSPLRIDDPAAPGSVSRAATSPAVELFVERARAVKPDFSLTAANTPSVVSLCRELDGLPLAIELAAARMRLLTPEAVLSRLHRSGSALGDARDLPERQRTLHATIAWSEELLASDERAMLRDLGVFSAGFTLDAVEAVAAGRPWAERAFDALEALVDNSLVSQSESDGEAVFTMLVTVREYAVDRLRSSGDEERMRDAHAAYFLDLARRISPLLGGSDQRSATRRLDLERGNLRTAVRHLIAASRADAATEIAWRLYIYWWLRGFFYEVRVWMEELMAAVPDMPPHSLAIARFYYLWSEMWRTDEREDIVGGLLECGAMFAATGDEFGRTMSEATAGLARVTMGDPDIASAAVDLERCAARFREGGDRWAEVLTLIALGRLAWTVGDTEGATERFAEASVAARAGGGIFGLSVATHHLARLRLLEGDTDAAAFRFTEAMRMSMELDHDEGIAYAIEGLSAIASLRGDVEAAGVLVGAAETIRERLTMYDAPQFVFHLAYLTAATRDPEPVEAARERGRAMTASQAAAYALAHVPAVPRTDGAEVVPVRAIRER